MRAALERGSHARADPSLRSSWQAGGSRRQDANTLEQQNDAQLDDLHSKLRSLHAVGLPSLALFCAAERQQLTPPVPAGHDRHPQRLEEPERHARQHGSYI